MPSIAFVTFAVGLFLIVMAVLGGGIRVKEIEIPALPIIPRILSFFTGCAFLALLFFRPDFFQVLSGDKVPPVSPPNPPPIVNPSPREIEPNRSPASPPSSPLPPSLPKPLGHPGTQTSWYVMLGSFDANNGDFAVSSANRVKNHASEECHVSARTELTAKMEGFAPGYVSSFLGPYDTQKDAAADKAKVLPCVPDAYIKSIAPN